MKITGNTYLPLPNPQKIPQFCLWLRQQMSINGITQAELGRRIGVSKSTMSLWLKGERLPSATNKERLAVALNKAKNPQTPYTHTRDELLLSCHIQEFVKCTKPS